MKALLDLATTYGFDKNLWHNYLTFVLVTNENSFSMTSEKVGANNGTVNHFEMCIRDRNTDCSTLKEYKQQVRKDLISDKKTDCLLYTSRCV